MIKYNLTILSKKQKDEINIDLVASSVAYKERNNLDVLADAIESKQPKEMQIFFRKRLLYYRNISNKIKNFG